MQVEKFQLGDYLKGVRESQHLSTHEMERRAKEGKEGKSVTAGQISRIETGQTNNPGFKTIQKIAEVLNIPLVIILDGSSGKTDAVTVVSTDEVAQVLPEALNREKLVQLLMFCMELPDEQIDAILGVARAIRNFTRSVRDTDNKQK